MSKYDKERQALGMKASNNYSDTQTNATSKYAKDREAIQKGTTVEGLERANFKDAYIARDKQKREQLNATKVDPIEQEVLDAVQKVNDRPWYLPKAIAIPIEGSKLSPEARVKFAKINSDEQANSAGGVAANAFVDSASFGLKPTLEKKQAEKFGEVGREFLRQQEEAKANQPVANTVGTIAGYLLPGAATEKVAAKALAPMLTGIGSKVAQKAILGAATGGGMELVEGAIRGESPEDIANRTVTGAGFGAVGDVALYGLGKGVTSIVNKLKTGKALTKAETEIAKNSAELMPKLSTKSTTETANTGLKTAMDMNTLPKQETSLKTDLTKPDTAQNITAGGEVKERGFSQNIRTDINRPDAERAIFDAQPEFYNVLNNETTLQSAQRRFSQGYEQALKEFDDTKNALRADNVPLAKLIADEAVKRGDVQTARRVLVDVSETLTTAGQYSQAAKILRESNDPATILTFVEREVKKLNTQGKSRYGKGWKNIDLTDDELSKIGAMSGEITDDQKEQLFNELFTSISTRIPTTAREKFDAWRRIAMLFNPKTHIRNVAGNSMMAGLDKISGKIAATAELGLKPELKTKALKVRKEFKDIANQYWEANKKSLTEGGRWELFGVKTPFSEKRTFKTQWLETLNDVSKKTLENEDLLFMKYHFNNNLAGFMQSRGLKEPTQEAVEYATKRAQEATFREANAIADAINKLKGTKGGLIVEAAIPFTKTPANILTTGTRYSPIGLINSAVQLIRKEDPAKVIDTFSKGLTGTGLTMMGFYMAKNGLARGEYEQNKNVEGLKQASGELPNSIITPQGSFTLDWAQPASMPFFMGVGMAESMKENGGDYAQIAMDALIAGGDSLINQSMLKNIKDLFGGYGSTTEKVMQLPVNYLQQAFPTVSGQIARTADPFKRQTDYSTAMSRTLTGLQAKTPEASKQLPLKRDILGQPQKYGEGVLNVIQQFISPGYIAKKSDDPIITELNRLYESEGSDFLPRASVLKFTKDKVEYKLTNDEASEFQRVMGEYTKDKLTQLIESSRYTTMSDADKARAIKSINDDGYELAKQKIIDSKN